VEWAGKPNSVAGDHVSRPVVADRLVHPTRSLQTSKRQKVKTSKRRIDRSVPTLNEAGRPSLLIWACWRWGLPCRGCHQPRGALLPHHFTFAGETSKSQKIKTSKDETLWTPCESVRHPVVPFLTFWLFDVLTFPRLCLFCGTFPRLTPGWRYQPPCPAQFGLSSQKLALANKPPVAPFGRSPSPTPPDDSRL